MTIPMTNQANGTLTGSTDAANDKSRLTLAAGKATGKLFCGYHQGYANADAGRHLVRNKTKKWMCGPCMKLRGIGTSSE